MANSSESLAKLYLETERLLIRPAEEADLESIYQIHADDEVNRYLPYDTWLSRNDASDWYKRVQRRRQQNDAEQFVVIHAINQKIVGTCTVFDFDVSDFSCELGYVLNRLCWNRGFMFEAMKALTEYLLSQDSITSVRAVVEAKNTSSLKLLKKLGFDVIYIGTAAANSRPDSDVTPPRKIHYLRLSEEH